MRVTVAGPSMRPALEPGDHLLVLRVPTSRIRPGHLVVVCDPRDPARRLVKRVVAVTAGWVRLQGDNEQASTDSRQFGEVPVSEVAGRVVYRYAPAGRTGRVQ